MFQNGEKVHYTGNYYNPLKNGIVKEIRGDSIWVVYSCNGDWENYYLYTGQLTTSDKLKKGWI